MIGNVGHGDCYVLYFIVVNKIQGSSVVVG